MEEHVLEENTNATPKHFQESLFLTGKEEIQPLSTATSRYRGSVCVSVYPFLEFLSLFLSPE